MPPDTSPIPDYVSDRGPTEYFHGRVRILANFDKLVEDSMKPRGASTFLIQGAPGAGKTALLYELGKIAEKRDWKVVKIKTSALWDRAKMLRALGIGKWPGISRISMSLLEILETGISFSEPARSSTSMDAVDRSKRKNERLILVMDEAQKLASAKNQPADRLEDAKELLESIHNGELSRPVILLTAGLGPTLEAFETLGVSRFKEGCVVELGALSKASERAVIQDWLVKEGGAKGDPAPWIDAIAQQTHGWPRHVHSYAEHAAGHLKEKGGIMTPQGLKIVMELGEEGRKQYYKQRVSTFYGDQLQCLVTSIANTPFGEPTSRLEIVSSLAQTYGNDQAEDLLKDFIEKGILEKSGKGLSISIPSMHTWLKEEYGHERIEPTRERIARPTPPKDFGMER